MGIPCSVYYNEDGTVRKPYRPDFFYITQAPRDLRPGALLLFYVP
jgi:hypothetical protein